MPNNHGRVVVALVTPSGNVGAAYGISGRSSGSKKRRFDVYPDEGRVYVNSLGRLTPEQDKLKDLLLYNCMRARDGLLIVTNGAQTDMRTKGETPVRCFYDDFSVDVPEGSSIDIMEAWGYEPDDPIHTPRIALVRGEDGMSCLSMITKCGDTQVAKAVRLATLGTGAYDSREQATAMATYVGEDRNAVPWYLAVQKILDTTFPMEFNGETEQEIADEMYGKMDQEYVAAAAGAVFKDGVWHLAKKNRHETEAGFLAEFPE